MRKWETTVSRDGIGQAGIPTGSPMPTALKENLCGQLTMAVITAVTWPEDEDRALVPTQQSILLDLRTIGTRPMYLAKVPLLGWHQLYDEDLLVPRESKQDTSGDTMSTESASSDRPTKAGDLDGDWVLVGFLDNSLNKPVAFPLGLAHTGAKNQLVKADGRVRRIRFNGTYIQWDKDGNLILDATGAATDALGAKGAEVSNAGVGGKILLTTKDAAAAVSSIELDELGGITLTDGASDTIELAKATQTAKITAGLKAHLDAPAVDLGAITTDAVLKGTTFNTYDLAVMTALSTYIGLLGAALAQLGIDPALLSATKTKCLAAGAGSAPTIAAITAFLAAQATWLSTVTRTA